MPKLEITWNTGREYQPAGHEFAGQIIRATFDGVDLVTFDDLSRGIDGHFVLARPEFMETAASLKAVVMANYDRNAYRSGLVRY